MHLVPTPWLGEAADDPRQVCGVDRDPARSDATQDAGVLAPIRRRLVRRRPVVRRVDGDQVPSCGTKIRQNGRRRDLSLSG